MIPYGRQSISQDDIDAVVAVLKSDFLTQGPAVPAFEAAIARATHAPHAIAVSSATAALHIACLALDVGPGDVVWTTPVTFVASANCALYCGATVDFVDIDPATALMDPEALREKLAAADRTGTLPKVVIPVHLCGQSCDMAAIHAACAPYGVRIIEDASHAIGAHEQGRPVGDCVHSDICVFSFHPVKIVTTAEGGAATTRDPALAQKLELLRSHGITRDPALMTKPSDGGWYYQQITLGLNYRMTDLQAALGASQMTRLTDFVAARAAGADRYDSLLGDLPLRALSRRAGAASSWHLYVIHLDLDHTPPHAQVFDRLRDAGIGVNLHYIPVHLQPYYARMGFKPGDFPQSEAYYRGAISIPLHATLTQSDQDRVVAALKAATT